MNVKKILRRDNERLLDLLIEKFEKHVNSLEGQEALDAYQSLKILDAIRHQENIRLINQDLKAWYQGFGTMFAIAGVGWIIRRLLG